MIKRTGGLKRQCWIENHVCQIPIATGEIAICDEDRFEEASKICWSLKSNGYVHARKNNKDIVLHRFLYPELKMIDHINGNKLDNRGCNLREITHPQNKMNRPAPANNTSGFKGVFYNKTNKCWCFHMKFEGKVYRKCGFKQPEEAARAYDDIAFKVAKEFAFLNFPK